MRKWLLQSSVKHIYGFGWQVIARELKFTGFYFIFFKYSIGLTNKMRSSIAGIFRPRFCNKDGSQAAIYADYGQMV